jgi:hypothetical protein
MKKDKFVREFETFYLENKDNLDEKLIINYIKNNILNTSLKENSQKTYVSRLFSYIRNNKKLIINLQFIKDNLKL